MKIPKFLLPDTASIEIYSGDSAYGQVYETAFTARCRIEPTKLLEYSSRGVSQNNKTITVKARMFTQPDVNITENSKVTVNGETYLVISIDKNKGFTDSHKEILLGGA